MTTDDLLVRIGDILIIEWRISAPLRTVVYTKLHDVRISQGRTDALQKTKGHQRQPHPAIISNNKTPNAHQSTGLLWPCTEPQGDPMLVTAINEHISCTHNSWAVAKQLLKKEQGHCVMMRCVQCKKKL